MKHLKNHKNRKVELEYFYDPVQDGGKTVVWTATVEAPGDQKLGNNTAGPRRTTVKTCRPNEKPRS